VSYVVGFSAGYIYWDDEDFGNANSKGGMLPDGYFDDNTKMYYCCRYDVGNHKLMYNHGKYKHACM